MNWKTWPMGAAEAERAEIRGRKAFMSHAVDMDTETPICGKVKIHSLTNDSSQWEDSLPDCPVCVRKIQKATTLPSK